MKSNFKKYLGEGFLIVFSVLFALLINKSFENHETKKKKEIAKESMINELYRNQAILRNWRDSHMAINKRIAQIITGNADSIETELKKYDYLNFGVLVNDKPLIDAIITKSAWESATTTGIISEFDYPTIQKLTYVYSMQEILTERTITGIVDYCFDTQSHDMAHLDKILTQLQLRFEELTGQEELIIELYTDALKEITK